MALTASAIPSFSYRIKLFEGQKFPVHRCSLLSRFQNPRISLRCSTKVRTMAQMSEPSKLKIHLDNFGERLWEAFPESVKEFPWKKAEDMMLQRLLFLGEKALKWSLIILFIVSSLSDVMLSISRNRELMIPLGLFVGCMMADFLKETSQELLESTKEVSLRWRLLGIGSFFVLVKVVSVYFTIGGRVFLSHIGNGGLMQLLWLWKKLQGDRNGNETALHQDAPIANNVEE